MRTIPHEKSFTEYAVSEEANFRTAGRVRPLRRAPKLRLDVFNAKTSDITYCYTSPLTGGPAEGVNDIHFHPGEKRSFRLTLAYTF